MDTSDILQNKYFSQSGQFWATSSVKISGKIHQVKNYQKYI